MKRNCIFFVILAIITIPLFSDQSLSDYPEMQIRQQSPYLLHNAECVSFDGVIWTRNYGMKEYYISPSYADLHSSLNNLRREGRGLGKHRLIKIDLNSQSRSVLSDLSVKIPIDYPFETINVLLPDIHFENLEIPFRLLEFDSTAKPADSRPENRQLIYEQGFEEDLGNEYDIDGWVAQPNIIFRNICWGILDCEAYEGEQSLWCAADLYDDGWYEDPPDPCSSYTNWIWTYFARLQTIDVTVAEELVFEWWTDYALDPSGDGDHCRLFVQDYPTTDWMMVSEYEGFQSWTDFQHELEGFSNFAYYFDFESDDMEYSGGVYLDKISIYNTVPNLTFGEGSEVEYPFNYSIIEPHNLRVLYEVYNDSNVDVEDNFNVNIILSTDDDYSTEEDNYQLEEVLVTDAVPAGETISDEIVFNLDTINIPGVGALPDGNYHFMFYVDSNYDIEEYDEEDNLALFTGTLTYGSPNLIAGDQSDVTYPATPNTSQLQIFAYVVNDGTEATNNSFSVEYMLSADYDPATLDDNYGLGSSTIDDQLQPGGFASVTYIIDLEQTQIPPDSYWVFFFIDSNNVISESNENDNTWASESEIDYLGPPFLEVTPLVLDFPEEGGQLYITINSNTNWTIDNSNTWFSVAPMSGNGDDTGVVTAQANLITEPRTAQFTVNGAGQSSTVTVNQAPATNILYGDVDGTGIVDAYDASLTLQYVVGIPTGIDPFPEVAADVDGNGEISAYDAGLIMQYVVGLIDIFPVEEQSGSRFIPEAVKE